MAQRASIEGQRRGDNRLVAVVAICAVLVVALAVAFVLFARNASPGAQSHASSDTAELGQVVPLDMVSGSSASSKLAGATEVVGEDGLIHGETPNGVRYTVFGRDEQGLASEDKVTIVAVGDQIGSDSSMALADAYAGSRGDGTYDYTPFYQEVASFIKQHDLRYINQETCMGGPELGYHGYPTFNSPDACADAIGNVDFNMVSFCTNHTLDYGVDAALRSLDVLKQRTNSIVAGSYCTQEDRDTVHMIERNEKTFAFLAYTYGDNTSGTVENFPNQHILCGFDKEAISSEVKRAQEVADAVIVCMHWGSEYTTEPNDQQWDYARFLADLNVDLVLGTHSHSMQPTKYVTGEAGNAVPVVFGLSDFVSGWTLTDTILSGLLTGDFSWDDPDAVDDVAKGITVGEGGMMLSNLKWYPSIEWSDGGQTYVRMLKDMDQATVNANTRTEDVLNDWEHLRDMVNGCNFDIEVVM